MVRLYVKGIVVALALFQIIPKISAQSTGKVRTRDINSVYTAVPFLTIAPDSRSSSMGDIGAATTPDVNSLHWNAAKYAFTGDKESIALSYSPWLHGLVNDMYLLYLTGYKRIDDFQTIAGSLRYFSMGSINFTDDQGFQLDVRKPNEFALDVAYSRLFSENFSSAVAFRYVRSDISAGISNSGLKPKAGNSFAADISVYYHSFFEIDGKNCVWALGTNISNIGNKMSYSNDQQKMFLPTNLRVGGSLNIDLDSYNKLNFALDFNKLLVPTPPDFDANGNIIGKSSDVSVVKGIFQSFSDAPGGTKEEMHEVSYGLGLEYLYSQIFAVRAGYFHDHPTKGNRRYFTMGFGFNVNMIGIDFSYLVATHGRTNPLNNTIRLTFILNLGKDIKRSDINT